MAQRYNLRSRGTPERPEDTYHKDLNAGNKMLRRGKLPNRQNLINSSNDTDSDGSHTEEDAEDAQHSTRKTLSTSRGQDTSYSGSDDSRSDFSTTVSESFTFHRADSPSVTQEASSRKRNRLYPDLDDFGRQASKPVTPERIQRVSERAGKAHKRIPDLPSAPKSLSTGKCLKFVFFYCIVIAVLIGWIASGVWEKYSTTGTSSDSKQNKFDAFCERIEVEAKQFPSQASRLWKVVKASSLHVIQSQEPAYPAVLLLAADKRGTVLVSDLAEAVAEDFMAVMQVPAAHSRAASASFNISQNIGRLESGEQKQQLDSWLKNQFQQTPTAVVLHHLETLQPDAALLLHGYCDGDNAPYKNVLMILVVYMDVVAQDDRSVEVFLSQIWKDDHSLDKIEGLLSRVANNIGIVKN